MTSKNIFCSYATMNLLAGWDVYVLWAAPYVPNDCAGPNKLEGNYVIN